MGKKGKKAAKEQQARRERAAAARDLEARVATARRERATKIRDLEARVAALVERLDAELEDADVFSPLEERDDCPVCFVPLPLSDAEVTHMPCCGKIVCNACSDIQGVHKVEEFIEKTLLTNFDHPALKTETAFEAAALKIINNSPCPFCRSARRNRNMETYQNFAVKMGDSRAMLLIGNAFETGKYDMPKDELSALGWYVRAAEKGFPMALIEVATMCFEGTVVEKNRNYAEQLAMAAAKKGCAKAHEQLAHFYWSDLKADPLGVTQSMCKKMFDHLKFAAAGGCRRSMKKLEQNLRMMEITRQGRERVEEILEELGTAGNIVNYLDLDDDKEGRALVEKFEELDALGILTEKIVDGVRKEHEKAEKLEWTEEREESRNRDSCERIITMLRNKVQKKLNLLRAQAGEQERMRDEDHR